MLRRLLFSIVFGMLTLVLVPTALASCPGALPSRLVVGQPGRVAARDGVNLRAEATRDSRLVTTVPEGERVQVLRGPVCTEDFAWWRVQWGETYGWLVEGNSTDYWIDSLAPVFATVQLEDVRFRLNKLIAPAAKGRRTPASDFGEPWMVVPDHLRFTLNGYEQRVNTDLRGDTAQIGVFPAKAYNDLLGGALGELNTALQTRPDTPIPPEGLPVVNPMYTRVMVAQPQYLDFQTGTGIRFLAVYARDETEPEDVYYVYLGLTSDLTRYLQVFIPLETALPPEALETAAAPDDFSPSLEWLDRMVETVDVPLQPEPSVTASDFQGVTFTLNSAVATSVTGETIPTVRLTSERRPWEVAPEYTRFTFEDYTGPAPRYNLPMLAVYPVADYNRVFAGSIDEFARFLSFHLDPPTPSPALPVTPERFITAQPQYLDFTNGRGLRFLAYFTDTTEFITRDQITYVYLGLTNDGRWYVQGLFPVSAAILPEAVPATFNYETFVAGYENYLAEVSYVLNTALENDFTPSLNELDALVASIQVAR